MRDLHIVLAMAGRGSRFAKVGVTTPKPLIEVDGVPMFKKALSSLENIKANKRYTIIIRGTHEREYGLGDQLKKLLPGVNIVATDDEPTGALRDTYRSKPYLKPNEGVILLDCDLWFKSASYKKLVEDSLQDKSQIDGGVITFKADSPKYSYAEIGDNDMVIRTAEKQVISNTATTGAYFFAKAENFIKAAEKLLKQPLSEEMKEYYISFVYGLMLKQGAKIQAAYVDEFASFGTPEELAEYQAGQN